MLEETTARYPNKSAVIFGENCIIYQKIKEATDRLSSGLRKLGVGSGKRFALLLPNTPHFPIVFFALQKLGAVPVPISNHHSAGEIRRELELTGVEGIVYSEGIRSRVNEALNGMKHPPRRLVLGQKAEKGEIRLQYLIEINEPLDQTASCSQDDTAVILFTSGATGLPKGVELTHNNLLSNIRLTREFVTLGSDDGFMGFLPLCHPLGLVMFMGCSFHAGASMILANRFDAAGILKSISSIRPSHFAGFPAIYDSLTSVQVEEPLDLSSLKFCLTSGYSVRPETMEKFESAFHVPLIEGYFITEASAMVSFNSPIHDRKPGSLGLPLPGIEMRFVDPSGEEVKPGQVGEVVLQGPCVMKGYLDDPEGTKNAIKNGWLHTGDLAQLHDDGFGFLAVQKKNVIFKSGFHIYPGEIEKILVQHPKIQDAAVVGLPDPATGEELHAAVVLKDGTEASQEEIIEYCKSCMATYKCPKSVHFFRLLPKNPAGWVVKDLLTGLIKEKKVNGIE